MNQRKLPGIYPSQIAKHCGTTAKNVESICNRLGIERWSLGQLGRSGDKVPFSAEQAMRIIGVIRAAQGEKLLGRHRLSYA